MYVVHWMGLVLVFCRILTKVFLFLGKMVLYWAHRVFMFSRMVCYFNIDFVLLVIGFWMIGGCGVVFFCVVWVMCVLSIIKFFINLKVFSNTLCIKLEMDMFRLAVLFWSSRFRLCDIWVWMICFFLLICVVLVWVLWVDCMLVLCSCLVCIVFFFG